MLRKDLIWRQKPKELWLKDGDKNKFFPLSTIIKSRKIHIATIKDENLTWIRGQDQIAEYFIKTFQKLYASSNPPRPHQLNQLIHETISREENEKLTTIPIEKEIELVTKDIGWSLKSLGLEGILALFYNYWHIIKNDFITSIQTFFQTCHILKQWNATSITPIPKKQTANTFAYYRPISLSNICYKVISKIIANQLKPIMEKLISPNQ